MKLHYTPTQVKEHRHYARSASVIMDYLCDDYLQLCDEVEQLERKVKEEHQRGLEEGSSCQAILEIQGRERFLAELKKDGCRGCPKPFAPEGETMKVVVELAPGVWLYEGIGNIGNLNQTLVRDNAAVFPTNKAANLALLGARLDRPFPRAIIQLLSEGE